MKLFSRFTHNRLITDALREIRATRSRFPVHSGTVGPGGVFPGGTACH